MPLLPATGRLFSLLCVCALLLMTSAGAADGPGAADGDAAKSVTVVPTNAPRSVFGDGVREFKFRIESKRASRGKVVWRLALGTATVKAGELEYSAGAGAPAALTVGVAVPPVKDGVVVRTRLTLSVVEDRQSKPGATHEQDVWLFPEDPFAGRSEWLKKLKITLYDPKGDTAKVLTAAKVPFEEARGVEAVGAVKGGVLVVGEGASFKDEKGLGAALIDRAAAGCVVLVLAPAEGSVPIPGIGDPDAKFGDLSLLREIVRKLDKRLDPGGQIVASSVVVKAGGEAAAGDVVAGAAGWPWIDARAADKGRWALCGLGLIAKWETGPTPRFFFLRLLEHLTDQKPDPPEPGTGAEVGAPQSRNTVSSP